MPDHGYYERNKDKCIQQSKDSYARRKAADPKGVWLKQALHAARPLDQAGCALHHHCRGCGDCGRMPCLGHPDQLH